MGAEVAEAEQSQGGSILTTQRLILRLPEEGDAGEIVRLADNPNVALQTSRMPYPYREADAMDWIARNRRPRTELSEIVFVIVARGSNAILGVAGMSFFDTATGEIGYWLGEPHWRQGYATEAVQALIDNGFAAPALARICGRCRVGNTASRRVLEKCGFQYLGAGMVQSRALKGPVATEDFTLERFVWESLKRWGRR